MTLERRVALVTGASGGIGSAIALQLARARTAVAIGYGSNAEPAEDLARRLVEEGAKAVALGADLSQAREVDRLINQAEAALGPVDILVSNAGRGERLALEEVSVEEFDRTLAINLRAPFLLAQRTLPGMAERGFGRVLFVSSVAAFTGGIVGPHYAASKAGLHGLTHFLASRFAASGVTVNALAPALIADTGMLPGRPDELREQIPVRRLGEPGEVADLALAILRNPYITDQVISIDGGMYPR
jgi:3-oxoacyl-[acyl-carrier protein] reductase